MSKRRVLSGYLAISVVILVLGVSSAAATSTAFNLEGLCEDWNDEYSASVDCSVYTGIFGFEVTAELTGAQPGCQLADGSFKITNPNHESVWFKASWGYTFGGNLMFEVLEEVANQPPKPPSLVLRTCGEDSGECLGATLPKDPLCPLQSKCPTCLPLIASSLWGCAEYMADCDECRCEIEPGHLELLQGSELSAGCSLPACSVGTCDTAQGDCASEDDPLPEDAFCTSVWELDYVFTRLNQVSFDFGAHWMSMLNGVVEPTFASRCVEPRQ